MKPPRPEGDSQTTYIPVDGFYFHINILSLAGLEPVRKSSVVKFSTSTDWAIPTPGIGKIRSLKTQTSFRLTAKTLIRVGSLCWVHRLLYWFCHAPVLFFQWSSHRDAQGCSVADKSQLMAHIQIVGYCRFIMTFHFFTLRGY